MVSDLLKKTAIFADLDDGELARVAEICKEQKFASQASIFKEGEPGNRLYVIVTGEVRISRTVPGAGEEALAVLKPGSCFGEMSVFDRSERSTDISPKQLPGLSTAKASDRKSTRLNSSHSRRSRMPSSA